MEKKENVPENLSSSEEDEKPLEKEKNPVATKWHEAGQGQTLQKKKLKNVPSQFENLDELPQKEEKIDKPKKEDGRKKIRTEAQRNNIYKALETRRQKFEEDRKKVEELKNLEDAIKTKKLKKQVKQDLKNKLIDEKIINLKKQLEQEDSDEEFEQIKQEIIKTKKESIQAKKPVQAIQKPKPAEEKPPVKLTYSQYLKAMGY